MIGSMPGVVDELRHVRLFAGLNLRQLRQLARITTEREYAPGVTVVAQGTRSGVSFFIVAEGEGVISVDGEEVARIGPGDHFGTAPGGASHRGAGAPGPCGACDRLTRHP